MIWKLIKSYVRHVFTRETPEEARERQLFQP
jgi:hypothetical protein